MNRLRLMLLFTCVISSLTMYSQSDFEKTLKVGEVLVNGLSFFKSNKTEQKLSDSKTVESICIKNKLSEKITFSLYGKDQEGNVQKKELVI